jgi:chromosome partitioning protein
MFHVEHFPLSRLASPAKLAVVWRVPHAITLAVANQKGGVAKTTTAINLATSLAIEGFQVLLVDCDPQANATGGLGIARDQVGKTTYDLLLGEAAASEVIVKTRVSNLRLIPASRALAGANVELVALDRREFRLREALAPVLEDFDFILFDCPPALDLLTLNALIATRYIVIPMQAEYFALEGVTDLLYTIERIQDAFNPELLVQGVLLTMYDDRTLLAQQVTENLRGYFGDGLYKTVIPRNIRLAEAPSHGLPVLFYDPRSRGAEAYRALARELLERLKIPLPVEEA